MNGKKANAKREREKKNYAKLSAIEDCDRAYSIRQNLMMTRMSTTFNDDGNDGE